MALRFFADHCVPGSVIHELEKVGYAVQRVKNVMPESSSDEAVIRMAQDLDAILISLNGDFSDILRFPPADFKGIVALQLRNHPEILPVLMQRLQAYLQSNPEASHYVGKLIVVDVNRIRLRH